MMFALQQKKEKRRKQDFLLLFGLGFLFNLESIRAFLLLLIIYWNRREIDIYFLFKRERDTQLGGKYEKKHSETSWLIKVDLPSEQISKIVFKRA